MPSAPIYRHTHNDSSDLPEILCLGESMVLLTSGNGLPLASTPDVNLYVAGAESNVARGLAHLGHSVEWFTRVGDDPFGARILDFMSKSGVQTPNVVVDESRPTGVYFKDHLGGRSQVYYYRSRSAASSLSRADVAGLAIGRRRLVHLSGIAAALSSTCDDRLQAIIVEREQGGAVISFDVNYRRALWNTDVAGPRLLELAHASDIVMVGRDEANALWSTGSVEGVRELLPDVPQLVIKDAHVGATHFGGTGSTFVPALKIDVVEPVGAGDAFAAGMLSGLLRGWGATASLRLGQHHGRFHAAARERPACAAPRIHDSCSDRTLRRRVGSAGTRASLTPTRTTELLSIEPVLIETNQPLRKDQSCQLTSPRSCAIPRSWRSSATCR